MSKNTTGRSDSKTYAIGRGILYAASINVVTGLPGPYRDLGNSPNFSITIAAESLTHTSSREGLATIDAEVTLSQNASLGFTLEETNDENLAYFFSGEVASHTNVAVAGFSVHTMVADGQLQLGRHYDIRNASGNRAYGVDPSRLTVTTNEGTPVALVKDVDYELRADMGTLFTIATSAKLITSIGANKGLRVTLTADASAKNVDEVKALTKTSVLVALKFISINARDDSQVSEYQFHQITLSAEGDLAMISNDWRGMGFKATSQKNALADPDSPTLTIRSLV